MNYFELQLLFEARRREIRYEEKQRQLASHCFRAKQRCIPWIGLLSTLGGSWHHDLAFAVRDHRRNMGRISLPV